MPFRSYAEIEAFKLAVKDAGAQGKLGTGRMLHEITRQPVCAMAHGLNALIPGQLERILLAEWSLSGLMGWECVGITRDETDLIVYTSDNSSPKERAEKVCEVVDQIGVG